LSPIAAQGLSHCCKKLEPLLLLMSRVIAAQGLSLDCCKRLESLL